MPLPDPAPVTMHTLLFIRVPLGTAGGSTVVIVEEIVARVSRENRWHYLALYDFHKSSMIEWNDRPVTAA